MRHYFRLASIHQEEQGERRGNSFLQGVMKMSAHTHSALIQNRQFRARITRKECGHFNEVGRKNSLYRVRT